MVNLLLRGIWNVSDNGNADRDPSGAAPFIDRTAGQDGFRVSEYSTYSDDRFGMHQLGYYDTMQINSAPTALGGGTSVGR